MSDYDFVVIDSGCNIKNSAGVTIIRDEKGEYQIHERCYDYIGHGTAINYILHQNCDAKIYNINIADKIDTINIDSLIQGVDFVLEHIKAKIVLICCGITENSSKIKILEAKLKKINNRGSIVIAANSNDGFITFPAAFDFVIGVEESKAVSSYGNNFDMFIGGFTNIVIKESFKRVLWDDKIRLVKGNSFGCAYFASLFFKLYNQNNNLIDTWRDLIKLSKSCYKIQSEKSPDPFPINKESKCITFPFNKEIKGLALFDEMCIPNICTWCDVRVSPYFGKKINSLITGSKIDDCIKDIFSIDWNDDFDTVILGNVEYLNRLLGIDLLKYILEKSEQHNKKIYALEKVPKNINQNVFFPSATTKDIDIRKQNKLYNITTAVVGIWGTSSKQGKFTLQLNLKKQLKKMGFNVGYIATEPTGYLFGADYVFPMGFNSTVEISKHDSINVLNSALHDIECKNKDIVIVGSQSGTIPFSLSAPYNISFEQNELIFGTNPCVYVLCVNIWDEIDYIKRTVSYLNSINNGSVIALAILGDAMKNNTNGENNMKVSQKDFNAFSIKIKGTLNLPIYNISSAEDINKLCALIINSLV